MNTTTKLYDVNEQALKKGWTVVKSMAVKGDGILAPGDVVMSRIPGHHPFVVHFFNRQDGGFYFGEYHETYYPADAAYSQKCNRYRR